MYVYVSGEREPYINSRIAICAYDHYCVCVRTMPMPQCGQCSLKFARNTDIHSSYTKAVPEFHGTKQLLRVTIITAIIYLGKTCMQTTLAGPCPLFATIDVCVPICVYAWAKSECYGPVFIDNMHTATTICTAIVSILYTRIIGRLGHRHSSGRYWRRHVHVLYG